MSEATSFRELMRRVRAGDQDAAAELVRRYEPAIRREVRVRLTDRRMRRVLDSADICQSVLGNFFARAALGQFDLQEPRQLLRLLVTMARNKVIYWARKTYAPNRDKRREQSIEWAVQTGMEPQSPDVSPSENVAGAELLEEFRSRLSAEERQIAEQRAAGREWAAIAAERGSSPEALRKRMERAFDRVAQELGLESRV